MKIIALCRHLALMLLLFATMVGATGARAASVTKISRIDISGSTITETLNGAAGAFIGRPLTKSVLEDLANKLKVRYAASYVAIFSIEISQARGGVVSVHATEGFVESVVFSSNTNLKGWRRIRTIAEKLRSETPLEKVTLQRALRLISAVPGLDVTANMVAGRTSGGVVLSFSLKRKPRRAAFSFDNNGNALLGRSRGGLSAALPELLVDGDQLDFTASHALNRGSYSAGAAAYSVPIGDSGLSTTLTAVHASTEIAVYRLANRIDAQSLSFRYPLILSGDRELTTTLDFTRTNSNLEFFENPLATQRTRSIRWSWSYSINDEQRAVTLNGSLVRGLGLAGAHVTQAIGKAEFSKVYLSIGAAQTFGKRLVGRLRAVAQYSPDRLPSAESLSVGGAAFGKAFGETIANGDNGFAGSVELAWLAQPPGSPRHLEIYGGLDGASLRERARTPFPAATYRLASAFAGVRTSGHFIDFDVTAARALAEPYAASRDNWRLSVGCRLHLVG